MRHLRAHAPLILAAALAAALVGYATLRPKPPPPSSSLPEPGAVLTEDELREAVRPDEWMSLPVEGGPDHAKLQRYSARESVTVTARPLQDGRFQVATVLRVYSGPYAGTPAAGGR
jgi:hypothetical protein